MDQSKLFVLDLTKVVTSVYFNQSYVRSNFLFSICFIIKNSFILVKLFRSSFDTFFESTSGFVRNETFVLFPKSYESQNTKMSIEVKKVTKEKNAFEITTPFDSNSKVRF